MRHSQGAGSGFWGPVRTARAFLGASEDSELTSLGGLTGWVEAAARERQLWARGAIMNLYSFFECDQACTPVQALKAWDT